MQMTGQTLVLECSVPQQGPSAAPLLSWTSSTFVARGWKPLLAAPAQQPPAPHFSCQICAVLCFKCLRTVHTCKGIRRALDTHRLHLFDCLLDGPHLLDHFARLHGHRHPLHRKRLVPSRIEDLLLHLDCDLLNDFLVWILHRLLPRDSSWHIYLDLMHNGHARRLLHQRRHLLATHVRYC